MYIYKAKIRRSGKETEKYPWGEEEGEMWQAGGQSIFKILTSGIKSEQFRS